jgi:hypothetical protein
MIFSRDVGRSGLEKLALLAAVLSLAACAGEERDDTTGSRLYQAPIPQGQKGPPPIEAGDIAIAAQLFSHDIRELPQVSGLTVPQLVQFAGVTSIVRDENGQLAPVDTQPYTDLLRDRLLLGDREKLRFVERQLPAFHTKTAHKDAEAPIQVDNGDANFRVLAELRGHANSNALRIQMEFVARDGSILLNNTYRIRPEAAGSGATETISDQDVPPMPSPPEPQRPAPSSQSADTGVPPVPGVDDPAPEQSLPTHYNPPPPPQ